MERIKVPTDKKGRLLPRVIHFEEFTVGCDTLEKVQDFIVKNYKLKVAQDRHFDLEGCINDLKINKLKEKGYFNSFDEW